MTFSKGYILSLATLGACTDTPKAVDPCEDSTGILTDDGMAHDTISEAGRAAGPGGTVTLCPGRFATDVAETLYQGVTVRGAGTDQTHIELIPADGDTDAPYRHGALVVRGDDTIAISSLTVSGGMDWGDTEVAGGGGAIGVLGAGLLLDRVRLVDNQAGYGGALSVGNFDSVRSSVTIRDSEFLRNEAFGGSAFNVFSAATVVVEDTNFGVRGLDGNVDDDVALYDGYPSSSYEPEVDLLASYDFEGTVSFTCEWETATCE